MTDSQRLLSDLQAEVDTLQDDLRRRAEEVREFDDGLRAEYAAAVRAHRTADTFETWREEPVTQAAVAWVLGTVFVRFLEDNGLVDARLSGSPERRRFALDRHDAYFEQHPLETDREYLNDVFREVGELPAAGELFDERHNPLWRLTPSGDGAKRLLDFWQRIDPATGTVAHTFDDASWDTRILGDLYQDLSESARKRYALLQTPRFVEAFILDRTLTPAIETFGYREATVIDPTCGSGHFLLGSFDRLLALHETNEPAVSPQVRVKRVLEQIAGVDLNPFATAIARFRLLLAAMRACRISRLADAPAFDINVATGDSLLHGQRFSDTGRGMQLALDPDDPSHHHFATEDERVDRILGRQYHAVVGNPPYIVVRDRALNALYRQRYASCHRQYSLVAPFTERFFELASPAIESRSAGYIGMIVANSFMKREFGIALIETCLPRIDLTHVIDTSGAYIPGHGTPTVILMGRNRGHGKVTRAVMGIRGEPSTPEDPSRGQVWSAMLAQLDQVGSESAFVSVRDLAQEHLHTHPWSIGGGGASELKTMLEGRAVKQLDDVIEGIGRTAHTGEDEAFLLPISAARTYALVPSKPAIEGEGVRDFSIAFSLETVFPYEVNSGLPAELTVRQRRHFWPLRTTLRRRLDFGQTPEERGLRWFDFSMFFRARYASPLSIAFAEVATHNHFVLDRGGKVFKQTAPVIKLAANATEDDHYALLGLLNSSTACFWMKQVAHQKQLVGGDGVRVEFRSKVPYQFSGTQLGQLPIPARFDLAPYRKRIVTIARAIDSCSTALSQLTAEFVLARAIEAGSRLSTDWDAALAERALLRRRMTGLQEDLDFLCYEIFEIPKDGNFLQDAGPSSEMSPGERAFEILAGSNQDGFAVPSEIPSHWPGWLQARWRVRADLIRTNPDVRLVEDPHYKRRWIGRQGLFNHDARRNEWTEGLTDWLLNRLESLDVWHDGQLRTSAQLADVLRGDSRFMTVAEAYRGRPDFDVTALISELVESESVPYLSVLRYKESGLRKREQWERTWGLQRQEDLVDARVELPTDDPQRLTPERAKAEKARLVGDIPVPPKYASTDFRSGPYWRLRGKLDVPKERFITYPGAERSVDPTPVVAWAGWDHLQQAQALANYIVRAQDDEGWQADRLVPLLAGLLELVPWLKQWHNELDPQFQLRMGDYYADFVQQRARGLGVTLDDLRAWKPAEAAAGRRRGKRSRAEADTATE